jgi:glutamine synthetase adenylyltransferase
MFAEPSPATVFANRDYLQQAHVWNLHWTMQEEWRRTFEDLKRSGKARSAKTFRKSRSRSRGEAHATMTARARPSGRLLSFAR